jgi:endonuclease YncB( thermonuclease family)
MGRAPLGLFLGLLLASPAWADLNSYAIPLADGSLRIQGETVRLYGIYVPPTAATCRANFDPVECGSRAQIALDFKTANDFVACRELAINSDGTLTAICWVDGEDLAGWLLSQGWAFALPGAPYAYQMLQEVARSRGLGLWGFQADVVRVRPR